MGHLTPSQQFFAERLKVMHFALGSVEMQRKAPDGQLYTYDEFVTHYGGDSEWNAAGAAAMPQLKLLYFDVRGLAETTRYMLAWAKVEYEDFRYPVTFGTPGDCSTVARPEFDAAQAAGDFAAGMGKVPVLEVSCPHAGASTHLCPNAGGGRRMVRLAQSKAIERYVARLVGLAGGTALEQAQVEVVAEHVRDIKQAYQTVRRGTEAEKDTWFATTLAEHSAQLEASLSFCVANDNFTQAHFAIYTFYTQYFSRAVEAQATLQNCPQLTRICNLVRAHPEVVAWEARRPVTAM
jgi:glutathione S-transferase